MFKKFIFATVALAASVAIFAQEPAKFNVASYNVRLYTTSDSLAGNTWERRGPMIAQLAQFHDFDIFGTQEGYRFQLNSMKDAMPGYDYIGVGRDDGKEGGEHSAIFYNTNLFEMLDHGDFWLAEDTTYPHKGWDAACIRICTWGKFRHKPSGKEFLMFNLHMDHVGEVARVESAKLIKRKMDEFGYELPAFLTGDFNVDQWSESYKSIVADGKLLDSYEIADFVYAPNGTFNDWQTDAFSDQRIDHIFVTPGVKVLKYGIMTDTYRSADGDGIALTPDNAPKELKMTKVTTRNPSDHFPIRSTVVLP